MHSERAYFQIKAKVLTKVFSQYFHHLLIYCNLVNSVDRSTLITLSFYFRLYFRRSQQLMNICGLQIIDLVVPRVCDTYNRTASISEINILLISFDFYKLSSETKDSVIFLYFFPKHIYPFLIVRLHCIILIKIIFIVQRSLSV